MPAPGLKQPPRRRRRGPPRRGLVVAIDGPAGSGKSTAARNLAEAEGLAYLNTGALYRAVTLLSDEGGLEAAKQPERVAQIAAEMDFEFRAQADGVHFLVAPRRGAPARDLTPLLFTAALTRKLEPVVNNLAVRAALVNKMRAAARRLLCSGLSGVVLEGRDIGTVVFPRAQVKFFLHADLEERARRRAQELRGRGETFELRGLQDQLEFRDRIDSTRAVGPLRKASDAIAVDTTDLAPCETLARLRAELAKARRAYRRTFPAGAGVRDIEAGRSGPARKRAGR